MRVIVFLFLIGRGCGSLTDSESTSIIEEIDFIPEVEIDTAKFLPFDLEIISNGKIVSLNKAYLNFSIEGIIKPFSVKEGDYLEKGQKIASLETDHLIRRYRLVKLNLEKSKLDYEDQLLSLGHSPQDTSVLDSQILFVTQLRSGLLHAKNELDLLEDQISESKLFAPFSGNIADIVGKAFNWSSNNPYFCLLIDNENLSVEFKVMEHETSYLKLHEEILIETYPPQPTKWLAKISAINPLVDEHGLVKIQAIINKKPLQNTSLKDGMLVKIRIQKKTENFVRLPKEAVLSRQGKSVVFTVKNGLAHWNYVEIIHENLKEYAIKSEIKPQDKVIIKGNFHLVDQQAIQIKYENEDESL